MSDILTRLREPPFGTETSERNLMISAADEIEKLRWALWQAQYNFDNAHRELLPRVQKLQEDAMRISQIVDPPVKSRDDKDEGDSK
jgi:hypothetical protein